LLGLVTLTRSPEKDQSPGDFLVDNMAGWLNAAIEDPLGNDAQQLLTIPKLNYLSGWLEIMPSDDGKFHLTPVLPRLIAANESVAK
jgi:hypothetical protein